jgi:hypothetical protein
VHQYYWWQINDGYNYNRETDSNVNPIVVLGDPVGKHQIAQPDNVRSVQQLQGTWYLVVGKVGQGSVPIALPGTLPFETD